jgi:hypothetical protein
MMMATYYSLINFYVPKYRHTMVTAERYSTQEWIEKKGKKQNKANV